MKHSLVLLLVIVALAAPIAARRHFMRGRSKYSNLGTPVLSREYILPEEEWFKQDLDHFNPTDPRTWHQRYYFNRDHWKKNGPVFLMIGAESEATAEWMVEGQWIEYAKQYGALCFQLEHRFYGKSKPTEDLSVKNLVYLSTEQALADLATFIEAMNHQYRIPADTKWIVFGGSYAGSLAAWLRVKYPHLVHAAISSSAPLLAQIDFQQYFIAVENALQEYSQACVDALVAAIQQMRIMLRTRIGRQNLTRTFRMCDPLDPAGAKPKDVANLYLTVADKFAEIVQYNKDNRNTSKVENLTIDDVCNILGDKEQGVPIERLGIINGMFLNETEEECLDYKYSEMVDELRNVTWESENADGGRQWMYQTCTEFGFFQTSTATPHLFSETFPVDFYVEECTDVFGPTYNMHLLQSGVERTNTFYGEKHLKVSNVVFVHGSIDPWYTLGIIESKNPQAPAIFINGTAHCADMFSPDETDPPALTDARKIIGQLIGDWLKMRSAA